MPFYGFRLKSESRKYCAKGKKFAVRELNNLPFVVQIDFPYSFFPPFQLHLHSIDEFLSYLSIKKCINIFCHNNR